MSSKREGRPARPNGRIAGRIRSLPALLGIAAIAAVASTSATGLSLPGLDMATAPEPQATAHQGALDARASGITLRQRVLDRIVQSQPAELAATDAAEFQAATATGAALAQAAVLLPEPAALAARELHQAELVELLTARTEARAAVAEQSIRRVGLNPRLMVAKLSDASAQGGPLEALAGGGTADPRLAKLTAATVRMGTLQRVLDTIPSHLPAGLEFISSPFGVRSDPITGEAAVHAGLDFRGPIGSPIHAAAAGTVTFAGIRGSYGNCIEIAHGNGMTTRYAHMSAFKARVGQQVAAGEVIGAIGSTGRSTGPHLHFEVRINGGAVNPRQFLQTGSKPNG